MSGRAFGKPWKKDCSREHRGQPDKESYQIRDAPSASGVDDRLRARRALLVATETGGEGRSPVLSSPDESSLAAEQICHAIAQTIEDISRSGEPLVISG